MHYILFPAIYDYCPCRNLQLTLCTVGFPAFNRDMISYSHMDKHIDKNILKLTVNITLSAGSSTGAHWHTDTGTHNW